MSFNLGTKLPWRLKAVISGLCASGMVFVVLRSVNWYVGGDWLFSIAMPTAGLSLAYAWAILLVTLLRISWWFKSAAMLFVAGLSSITINPFVNYLLEESQIAFFVFVKDVWQYQDASNLISAVVCVALSVTLSVIGIKRHRRK